MAPWNLHTLFTAEDTFNFHKTLGIACLFSYAYRFANVGESDMKFDASNATLFWIGVHALLSVSSLIFKIPKRRIVEGSRIWPEYRLHSISFAVRSLLCLALYWAEKRFGFGPVYWLNPVIVILTLLMADGSTLLVGKDSASSTINDLHAPALVKFFFSVMQFHATTSCLAGPRRSSTQFLYVWIIQFTAFMMTLNRKHILGHLGFVYIYLVMLIFGFCVAAYDFSKFGCFDMVSALANLAAVTRMGLRVNKYVLWSGFAVAMHFARKTTGLDPDPAYAGLGQIWRPVHIASLVLVALVGYWKMSRKIKYSNAYFRGSVGQEATKKKGE